MIFNISRRLFFFVLIFSPLAFGAVEPWSLGLMETGAAAGLFLYLLHAVKNEEPVFRTPGIFFIVLFLGYILIQVIPLPFYVVKLISPHAFDIQQNAGLAAGKDFWMTLSVHPRATLAEFFRYSACAAFYVLTVQLLVQKKIFRKAVFTITVFAALLAFSSILQYYLANEYALWFRKAPDTAYVMGPFINRNHYAGFMEMMLPISLALFLFFRPKTNNVSFIRRVLEIFTQEKANIYILIGTGVILIATSIFVSLSRGGMISAALSMIVFIFFLARRRITRKETSIVSLVLVVLVLSVSWIGGEHVVERFSELKKRRIEGNYALRRLDYWQDSIKIVQDFSVAGAGFGTLKDMYPSYQSIPETHYVTHAHNDYIELAAEGGAIAFILVAGFVATILRLSYQAFQTRRDAWAIHIYIGAVTGIAAILFHSFSDFNLHIGANGLWFFFLLGIAVSAAHTRMQTKEKTTMLPEVSSGGVRKAAVLFSGVFLVVTAVSGAGRFLGDFYYSNMEEYEISLDTSREDLKKMRDIASHASLFDPLNAGYAFAKADTSWLLGDRETAEREFVRAIELNPSRALYYKRYGLFLSHGGEREKALEMLELSVRYDRVDSDNALEYGALLVYQGQYDKGLRYLKKAVELNSDVYSQVLTTMAVAGFSSDRMRQAVPETPGAVIEFAEFLYNTGENEVARSQYLHALDLMEQSREVDRSHLFAVYRFFRRQGKISEAMDVLKRGEALLPSDARIKIALGDLYKKQGVLYKAKDKYEQALIVDPGNSRAQRRLNQ